MDREELAQRLMATFLDELEDHVATLNRELLALERGPEAAERAEIVARMFRAVHSLKGAARAVSVELVEAAAHHLESVLGGARASGRPLGSPTHELLFGVLDALGAAGRLLREGQPLVESELARILPQLERLSVAPGAAALEPRRAPPPVSDPAPAVTLRVATAKLDRLLAGSGELMVAGRAAESSTDRLLALRELLDRSREDCQRAERPLMTLLRRQGLLPAAGARRASDPSQETGQRVARAMERARQSLRLLGDGLDQAFLDLAARQRALERAATRIDDDVQLTRTQPFLEACEGLDRAVRDASRAARKDVELVLVPGAVEADRAVLEALRAPLLHLVRNAVAHGIEPPDERERAGKLRRGRVTVSAELRGAAMVVRVRDDGGGVDLAALRSRAAALGVAVPSDPAEQLRLIFSSGLSTAPAVDGLAGRGVGLDVVKTQVERARGSVDVSSTPGAGTELALSVPLTLSKLRALLVSAGGQTLALPSAAVERLLRVQRDDLRSLDGRETLALGGPPTPLVPLATLLGAPRPPSPGDSLTAVLLTDGPRRVAVAVDEALAERQLVIQGLGRRLRGLPAVSATTLLPDGRVALVLEPAELVRRAHGLTAPEPALAPAESRSAPRRRVLVADDSVTTRSMVQAILEASGYEVVGAVDGGDAWDKLQRQELDAVVADVEMPRMDGFALTRAIRSSHRLRPLPVILVTALESDADRLRGLEAGADAYVMKSSFDQRALLESLRRLLGRGSS